MRSISQIAKLRRPGTPLIVECTLNEVRRANAARRPGARLMDRTLTQMNGLRYREPWKRRAIAAMKWLLWRTSPRAFNSLTTPHQGQTFSIGIYRGQSPLELREAGDVQNPVLTGEDVTDVPAAFVADPFMLLHEGRWYLFMEVFNRLNRRGEIGVATSTDGISWHYQRIVLREPFHLAYPFLLRWRENLYMIPDSPGHGVRLYQASTFPYAWQFSRQLISHGNFSDSTLFRHQDRWWMLTAWTPTPKQPPLLRLFSAAQLEDEWIEHPQSPLLVSNHDGARPAGPVFKIGNRMFRVAQDCTPCYGKRVYAFEILELSTTRYREQLAEPGVIVGSGRSRWHSGGMHHVNAHQAADGDWIACVDGWYAPDPRSS
jgi:hypothetical protein